MAAQEPPLTAMQIAFIEGGVRSYRSKDKDRKKKPISLRSDSEQMTADGSRYGYRGGKLAHLLSRRSITPRQHEAGQRWVADYRLSTASRGALQETRGGGSDIGLLMQEAALAGRRFEAARLYIGAHLAGIVWAIVGYDRDPSDIARQRQKRAEEEAEPGQKPRKVSPNSVIEVLRVGLDGLAEFYRVD